MRPLQIGRHRQRVTLQDLVEAPDTYGQPIQSWVDVATIWAEVTPLGGREALNVKQVWATASHMVRFRYLGASVVPSAKQRFAFKGRYLNILNVNNVEERNRSYEATCEEYVP